MNRILMIMTIVMVLFLIAFTYNKSVFDVLSKNGFGSTPLPIYIISDGSVIKNANEDVIKLLDSTKNALLVDKISETPSYTAFLLNGSSLDSQKITISVGRSGEGSVEYMGKVIGYFKSSSVYETILNSFHRSKIIIKKEAAETR